MEALILTAVLVGLVWGALVLGRGGPIGACLVFLLAATCLSSDFATFGAGSLKLTIDRLLWVVVILTYFVWWRLGRTAPQPIDRPAGVAIALVAFMAIRTFTADWKAENAAPVVHLVLWYIMPLGLYWVARQSRIPERLNTAILVSIGLFGIYLSVTVIAEKYEAFWLLFPRYIATTAVDAKAEFVGRGRGPLLHPIVTGIQLAACWSVLLMWWPRRAALGRSMIAAASLLFAVAVYATMTRSVWMGAGLSLAIIVTAALPAHRRLPVLGGALLVACVAAAASWETLVAFKRDKGLSAKETADSVTMRPIMARIAWKMVEDRPLWGCGFDQYLKEHTYYLADRSTDLVLEKARPYVPHNLFLGIVTETGLTGLALFSLMLFFWTREAWRLWSTRTAPLWARQQGLVFLATLGAYLVNGMFHHIVMIPMSNLLLFFLAGVVASLRGATVALSSPFIGSRTSVRPAEVSLCPPESPACHTG